MFMKKLIPNILTLSNLAAGNLALVALLNRQYALALGLLGTGLLFDLLDGMLARALRVHSELGKQLDSLADMVSFGVVPAFFMLRLAQEAVAIGYEPIPAFLPYLALLIPVFTALRLARFNLSNEEQHYFIGLPSPANALFICGYAYWGLSTNDPFQQEILMHPLLFTFLTLSASLMLVARVPLLAFKPRSLHWRDLRGSVFLLLGAIALILTLRVRALIFIFPLYLLLSLLFNPKRPSK